MRKFSFVFYLLISISTNFYAQWIKQNPEYFGDIQAYSFYSAHDSWFSVTGGSLFHLDIGKNVAEKIFQLDENITNISFVDSLNGYLTSFSYPDGMHIRIRLFTTSDGGKNWDFVSLIPIPMSTNISFVTKIVGFNDAGFEGVFRTSDGGISWDRVLYPRGQQNFINMLSEQYGIAKQSFFGFPTPRISYFETKDGGINWQEIMPLDGRQRLVDIQLDKKLNWIVNPASNYPSNLHPLFNIWLTNIFAQKMNLSSICVSDSLVNYAISNYWGYPSVYKSTDVGKNWDSLKSFSYSFMNSLKMFDDKNGCWTNSTSINLTNDGWNTEKKILSMEDYFQENLLDIYTYDGTNLTAVSNKGSVIVSNNKGNSWSILRLNNNETLIRAKIISDSIYYAISDLNFYRTTNQGITWHNYDCPNLFSSYTRLKDIYFIDKSYGWIACENHAVLRTENGGLSWELIEIPFTKLTANTHIQKIHFFDKDNGLILAGEYYIGKTTDGGKSFNISKLDWITTQMSVLSPNEWWLSTPGNGIRATYDGGNSYSLINPPNNDPATYKYPYLKLIYPISSNIKCLPGDTGELFFTTDNGISWEKNQLANSDLKLNLNSLLVLDEKEIWVVGDKGAIFYNNLESTDVKPHINPTDFSLSQNYPNPFNPETTISYSIPNSEHVTLKIYDLLGREIVTIVDEYKLAGSYHSTFNTLHSSLSSGVYFYRLQAGTYSETKKLVLMK